MLIRWANESDFPAWYALATEVSAIFEHPADMGADPEFMAYVQSKTEKYEALTAVDYMSGKNMGFIGFSRTNNRISWFAVSKRYRGKGAGDRLLKPLCGILTLIKILQSIRFVRITRRERRRERYIKNTDLQKKNRLHMTGFPGVK